MSLNKLMSQNVSVRTGFKIKKIREAVVQEFNRYEEMRKDLVFKFSEKDEAGNTKTHADSDSAVFTKTNEVLFSNKIKELQQIEFSLPDHVKLSELENAEMTGQDIINLQDVIQE
jgi:hypothetical protein